MSPEGREVVSEDTEIDEIEFLDRVDDLSLSIDAVCDEEDHAGVVVMALTHSLAVSAFDMWMANPTEDSVEDRVKTLHQHMDILLGELRDGTYFGEPQRLN